MRLFLLLLATLLGVSWAAAVVQQLLDKSCEGDLAGSLVDASSISGGFSSANEESSVLHIRSALELIVAGDYRAALHYHVHGKEKDKGVVPPLAQMHLSGKTCGGISDIFFVTAVVIKQTIDKIRESGRSIDEMFDNLSSHRDMMKDLQEGYSTLITLTSDAGLHNQAEALVSKAISLIEENKEGEGYSGEDEGTLFALKFRAALLTPAVYESRRHLRETRKSLASRVQALDGEQRLVLSKLDEFVVSPTFYYVYQGAHDKKLLSLLHKSYGRAYPDLATNHVQHTVDLATGERKKRIEMSGKSRRQEENHRLRVGFVSAHYRRHSICKLFCGTIAGLAKRDQHDVFLFSSLQVSLEQGIIEGYISIS